MESRSVRRFRSTNDSAPPMNCYSYFTAFLRVLGLTFALATLAPAQRSVESQKESDWIDARWNATELGNFHSSVVALPGGAVAKGLSIRLRGDRELSVVYDTATASLCAIWTEGFLKFDSARYGLLRAPKPNGEVRFLAPNSPAWNGAVRESALHVHDARVVLDYTVSDAHVMESPWIAHAGNVTAIVRSFEISGDGERLLTLSPAAGFETSTVDGVQIASVRLRDERLRFAVIGNSADFVNSNGMLQLR